MRDFKPDYNKCKDSRKEITHLMCKHCWKNTIMICNVTKKPCIAWLGYKHKFEVKQTYKDVLEKERREEENKNK